MNLPHSGGCCCIVCNWRLYWGLLWLVIGGAAFAHNHDWLLLAFAASPGLTLILWHADHWEQRGTIVRATDELEAGHVYVTSLEKANAAAADVIRALEAREDARQPKEPRYAPGSRGLS